MSEFQVACLIIALVCLLLAIVNQPKSSTTFTDKGIRLNYTDGTTQEWSWDQLEKLKGDTTMTPDPRRVVEECKRLEAELPKGVKVTFRELAPQMRKCIEALIAERDALAKELEAVKADWWKADARVQYWYDKR